MKRGVEIRVPGDKSISHRAILFGAMAHGTTCVNGTLDAEDVQRTRRAVEHLGAEVIFEEDCVFIRGAPWKNTGVIDCGNSGTTARLLLGALAPRAGAQLVGDASLSRRPMRRVLEPLAEMGAAFIGGPNLPIEVISAELHGIRHLAQVASAQVKSAILLAALGATGPTTYVEPVATRDHTERMLRSFGSKVVVAATDSGTEITISPDSLTGTEVDVPGDISSAAFWMAAAAIHAGSEVHLAEVGINPTRTGVIDVFRRMGVEIAVERLGSVEPFADMVVRGGALRGTTIQGAEIPRLVDELPAIAICAAFADGETVVRDAAELRVKESDRIAAIVHGLRLLGIEADERPDGFVIRGGGARKAAGPIPTHGDHRVAMAFSIAGLRVPVVVSETDSIRTSYPRFLTELERLRG